MEGGSKWQMNGIVIPNRLFSDSHGPWLQNPKKREMAAQHSTLNTQHSMRYFLEIAYVGTRYNGWQIQPRANTVQAEINKVLAQLFKAEMAWRWTGLLTDRCLAVWG